MENERSITEKDSHIMSIWHELERANAKFPLFNSKHEGLAIIEEEFLELRDEVFHGQMYKARQEAIQTAAMCLKFLMSADKWEEKPKFTPKFVKFGVPVPNPNPANLSRVSRDILNGNARGEDQELGDKTSSGF